MVTRQTEFADAHKLEDYLVRLETKGMPRFNSTLNRADIDERRRDISSYSRFKTQLQIVFLKYTLGYRIEDVAVECQQMLEFFEYHLNHQRSPFDMDFSQYILSVWALSAGFLFNANPSDDLLKKIPFSGRDMLVDRLLHCFNRAHAPTQEVLFPRVYGSLLQALGQYDTEPRNTLISRFLSGYFDGLKHYEAFWSESHLEADPRYYRHFGYWVFELGTLVIDARWDDYEFKGSPIYPKQLVDWKRTQ
ncbi:PoNe immunity protein domain-containing protein [Saccharospirillum salsuginis]|uniref:PoNi C-terminal domain-containing protein n=1 Tax=Saccharospirillum salsuginis TaxID=418750 RepID=A0A918NJS1_9GAMM|nr:PoNe immunity protein domain-containing protein [Saccharospirillum salsuginis]GGX75968.1 hypothetical protein GCM10007392_48750 [Saccharospirillum salsuginis]